MPVCPQGHDSAADDYCDTCGRSIAGGAGAVSVGVVPSSGTPLQRADQTGPVGAPVPVATQGSGGSAELCPDCQTPRTEGDRFCEDCGFDFVVAASHPITLAASNGDVPSAAGSGRPPAVSATPGSGPSAPTAKDITLPSVRAALAAARAQGTPAASEQCWFAEVTADRDYFTNATGGDDALTFPENVQSRRIRLLTEQVRIGRRSAARGLDPEIDLSAAPADPGISHLHAVLVNGPGGWQLIDPGSTNGTTLNDDQEPLAVNVPVPVGDGDRIHLGAWTTIVLRQTTAENGR